MSDEKIKRYEPAFVEEIQDVGMRESRFGLWIRLSTYKVLCSRLEAAEKELAEVKAENKKLKEILQDKNLQNFGLKTIKRHSNPA